MTVKQERGIRWHNVIVVGGATIVSLVGVPWYIVTSGLHTAEVVTSVALFVAISLSVTGGYHRLFAHRAYEAKAPLKLAYLIFGAGALENTALEWAAQHRAHHANTDREGDPYSIKEGFWWAHVNWVFHDLSESEDVAAKRWRDLQRDPLVVWQDRNYLPIAIGIAFGIPLIVGLAVGNVLGLLLVAGVLRISVTHHATFLINSLAHFWGSQPYCSDHTARDSSLVALLTMGEGYHNYHHTFPTDYRTGAKWWHLDPTKWMIYWLAKLGLARRLKRASPERVAQALASQQQPG